VYNGHVSTCDALWAEVPVLTCLGGHFASRVAAGLLHAVGLPELVAASADEYERMAVEYASNPARLHAVRERLARNRLTTPLFDTESFVRHLETAYLRMWETFKVGETPHSFSVDRG
jgi:predicted O-linked N-acetylglucosamine transferase (SPINDLY family)